MHGYLSTDIISVRFSEQIMSKDKYPSIFSGQMEAIVFIILQIFFAPRAILKIGKYPQIFPSFSWGIFSHVTRLDQSRAGVNICWIISIIINVLRYSIRALSLGSRAAALERNAFPHIFWPHLNGGFSVFLRTCRSTRSNC